MADAPDELRDRADEVMSDPKFAGSEPGLLDRLVDWVLDLLGDVLDVITDATTFGDVAVGWIILAAMLGLIIFFLVKYLPSFSSVKVETVKAKVETRRNRRTRAEWLADAEAAEAAGLHREAVRARYKATVAGLVEGDEVPDTPGATALELREAFEAEAARTDPFASSTAAFSDVWFGGQSADASDSAQVAEWDASVLPSKSGQGS